MGEKTIIQGKHFNIKLIATIIIIFFAIIPTIVAFVICYSVTIPFCEDWNWNWGWVVLEYGKNASVLTVTFQNLGWLIGVVALSGLVLGCILAIVFAKTYGNIKLIVTDKRVRAKTCFRKQITLPLDCISAVNTGMMKSIAVRTSSGLIKFALISNRNEVYNAICTLLIARQDKTNSTASANEVPQSNADELKKYKDLLDGGIITQEEFDAKKKQLLGL